MKQSPFNDVILHQSYYAFCCLIGNVYLSKRKNKQLRHQFWLQQRFSTGRGGGGGVKNLYDDVSKGLTYLTHLCRPIKNCAWPT